MYDDVYQRNNQAEQYQVHFTTCANNASTETNIVPINILLITLCRHPWKLIVITIISVEVSLTERKKRTHDNAINYYLLNIVINLSVNTWRERVTAIVSQSHRWLGKQVAAHNTSRQQLVNIFCHLLYELLIYNCIHCFCC